MGFEVWEMMAAGEVREGLSHTRRRFSVWHVQVTMYSVLCQEHDGMWTGKADQL